MDFILNILTALWSFVSKVVISAFPLVNALFIIGAGCLGLLLHGRFKPFVRELIVKCLGILVILFAVDGLWKRLFVLQGKQLEAAGSLLVVIALLIGWLFGEAMVLDRLLGKLGLFLHRIFQEKKPEPNAKGKAKGKKTALTPEAAMDILKQEDSATGFVIATTLCGFSSLLFTHFLEGRINDDPIPMLIKLAFDFVLVFWLASVYGAGVPFAGGMVLVSEGILGIVYSLGGDFFTPKLLGQLALVGAVILLTGGISLCFGKRFRAANLIPALFIPIVYTALMDRIDKLAEKSNTK